MNRMDHSHLVNYSFEHYSEFKSESGKLHAESGYESLLATSSTSFSNNDSNDSHIFSVPSSPVKTPSKFVFSGNNASTTPDFKQQVVADVNGFYFKTIRSSYGDSSPLDHYSSSANSRFSDTDYVSTRDNFNTKLLRSPAFKLESSNSPKQCANYQPERPSIKSFSSRFITELPKLEQVKPTLTEAEFMDVLISNHHLPANPEFLIGRNMGVDKINILGELNKRSMNNVLDNIFAHMSVAETVRVACVSKEWRKIVKEHPKLNRERLRFIKTRRHLYETTKENHGHLINAWQIRDGKRLTVSNNKSEILAKSTKCVKDGVESHVFNSLDINCLNNLQPINTRRRLLERQFKDFSISEETIFRMSPTKRSPMKKSPMKRSPVKASLASPKICSKKSKRNLKRL